MKCRFLCLSLVVACATVLAASATEYTDANFAVPSFRGDASTLWSGWDSFTKRYDVANTPDVPSSTGSASLFQTTSPGYITGGGNGPGNFYGFLNTNTFRIDDLTAYALGQVVFQTYVTGSQLDYATVHLDFTDVNGLHTLTSSRIEVQNITGGDLGDLTTSEWVFDLSPYNVTSYSIFFDSNDLHNDLMAVSLDTVAVPEPTTLAMLGLATAGVLVGRRFRH